MDSIITAVLALLGVLAVGVLVPIFLVGRADRQRREDQIEAARQHREDREAEWARQDAVAAKAAQAASDLAESQKAIAAQAAEAASLLLNRQDQSAAAQIEVAQQAAEAARLLLIKQQESAAAQQQVAVQAAEAARLLAENNILVAETAKQTGLKLDTIHTLVNSNMTAAMESERAAVDRELSVMRELIELRRSMGHEPSQEALSAVAATEAKLHELDTALAERARVQAQVNRKIGLDVITTTSYRDQEDPSSATEIVREARKAEPPGDEPEPYSGYAGEVPPAPEGGEA